MAIGAVTVPVNAGTLTPQAASHARSMGELVLHARTIASTMTTGQHGRRKQGAGDNFWQFRPYNTGESAARIDWRRSARDNTLYIRDREWEAAQTIYLWPDLGPSMQYQSRFALHSKETRALLITLILAEIFGRTGERIALPGLVSPTSTRNGAELMALALCDRAATDSVTNRLADIRRYAHVVLVGDFLDPFENIEARLARLAENNVRAHLIEIADPAEELFPYTGHVIFQDPEGGSELDAGKAESYREDYRHLYLARRQALADLCRRYGWSFCLSRTDKPLTETLNHINHAMRADSAFTRGMV